MKKLLEGELMGLAHRILQKKEKADVNELKEMAGELYEKLAVLSFTETYFEGPYAAMDRKKVERALNEKDEKNKKEAAEGKKEDVPKKIKERAELIKKGIADSDPPHTLKSGENEGQARKQQDPPIKDDAEAKIERQEETREGPENKQDSSSVKSEKGKQDKASPGGQNKREEPGQKADKKSRETEMNYDNLPQFERTKGSTSSSEKKDKSSNENYREAPAQSREKSETSEDPKPENDRSAPMSNAPSLFSKLAEQPSKNEANSKKQSLNDRLNQGVRFGLNDRLAFINNLFGGNATDFNRVVSQLNTFEDFSDAKIFLKERVKPDYDWENKEEYEARFLDVLEKRMK